MPEVIAVDFLSLGKYRGIDFCAGEFRTADSFSDNLLLMASTKSPNYRSSSFCC